MAKSQILFQCSEEFKEAMSQYAYDKRISASELIRQCVATHIGYDLSKEPVVDGRRKYKSTEDKKATQSQRTKESQQEVAKLIAMFQHESHLEDVQSLQDFLTKKGISSE